MVIFLIILLFKKLYLLEVVRKIVFIFGDKVLLVWVICNFFLKFERICRF